MVLLPPTSFCVRTNAASTLRRRCLHLLPTSYRSSMMMSSSTTTSRISSSASFRGYHCYGRSYHSMATLKYPAHAAASRDEDQVTTGTLQNTNKNNSNNKFRFQQCRYMGGGGGGQKVSAMSLTSKKRNGYKITMVTAYDFPSAVHVARANIDIILVGDSVAMVELGYDTTQPVTVEHMLHHCATVKRGVEYASRTASNSPETTSNNIPLLVGDMPFGSYEFDDTDIALRNAYRFVKEAGMDAVKLEGGSVSRAKTARKLVDGGIAVMGHTGLTPQAISVIGGFRAQGRTAVRARALLDDALRLQDAGAFAVVLECVPSNVADEITKTLEIPTIGIGAGNETSGQVLVFHDMLGMLSHPHHEQFVPKFCKKYAQVGHIIQDGLREYKRDVEDGIFPGSDFSPYKMTQTERDAFQTLLSTDANERKLKHEKAAEKYEQTDEYEKLHLYGTSSSSSTATPSTPSSSNENKKKD